MAEILHLEKIRLQNMLDTATTMVNGKNMTAENAVLMVGSLVDMDLLEPTTVLEHMVFNWLGSMEKHFAA